MRCRCRESAGISYMGWKSMAEGKLKLLQVSDTVHFSKRPGQQNLFHRLFSEWDLLVSLSKVFKIAFFSPPRATAVAVSDNGRNCTGCVRHPRLLQKGRSGRLTATVKALGNTNRWEWVSSNGCSSQTSALCRKPGRASSHTVCLNYGLKAKKQTNKQTLSLF